MGKIAAVGQLVGKPWSLSSTALLAVKGGSANTTEAYRATVRTWIAWVRERSLDLNAEALAAYVSELKEQGAGAGKRNMALYAGKAALLQAAHRAGMPARELALLKGVLDSIKGTKRSGPEIQIINSDERRRLLEALPLRVRLVARFLYVTGARISEALSVRCDHVVIDGERALVRLVRTKGDIERTVRIPRTLLDDIDVEYGKPGRTYLFESHYGKPFSRQYISREIGRASRRVLNRQLGAHVLRHSRATDLYQSTRRIKAVSNLLGHSTVNTTAAYYVRDSFSDEELFNNNGETL